MSVRKFDGPLRFLVNSHSREEIEHLVEIDAYDGAGNCSCEHFQYRLAPLLQEGAKPSDATRCAHICEAREFFIDNVIAIIKERQKTVLQKSGVTAQVQSEHNGTPANRNNTQG